MCSPSRLAQQSLPHPWRPSRPWVGTTPTARTPRSNKLFFERGGVQTQYTPPRLTWLSTSQLSRRAILGGRVLQSQISIHALEAAVLRFKLLEPFMLNGRHAGDMLLHWQYVVVLTVCLRQTSATAKPTSPSPRIARIWFQ